MRKCLLLLLFPMLLIAQRPPLHKLLSDSYETYKETSLENRRFKHQDITRLLDSLGSNNKFEITKLGNSIQGRSINMVSIGSGSVNVLLWSQMHGNEPTATAAMFDIFNYLKKDQSMLQGLRVHFIPMLNPDGAEVFARRNAIGIDLNRDAVAQQCPESKILKNVRDSLNADFGFNLHDQSTYYNAAKTEKPATLSFLAPAFNFEKDINASRGNAMRIISMMNDIVQSYAPGQVGRYSDEFEPRAFGDNMQKWGTSTILIESGGFLDDPEKQEIRKLNYVCILSALDIISKKSYVDVSLDQYMSIPRNDRKLFDLKLKNVTFEYLGQKFTVDLGINRYEVENKKHSDFYFVGRVSDMGDLSTYFGYQTINAEGYEFNIGKTYPKILNDFEEFLELDFHSLISQGYTSVSVNELPPEIKFTPHPMNIMDVKKIAIIRNNQMPKSPLRPGVSSSFLLKKNDEVVYAIINGFVYAVAKKENQVRNGVVK